MSKLYFRYGAMNSGKSTALLQAAYNYEERGQHVLLAKPVIDTKGDGAIVSRLGVISPGRLRDRAARRHLSRPSARTARGVRDRADVAACSSTRRSS